MSTLAPIVPPMPPGSPAPAPVAGERCLVCSTPRVAFASQCRRCGAPFGTIINPEDPTFSTYLPVAVPAWMGARMGANSTVRGATNWNWGAAGLGLFWALAHRVWWYAIISLIWAALLIGVFTQVGRTDLSEGASATFGLFLLFTIIGWPALAIYVGVKGNGLAWNSGRFATEADCARAQKIWARWTAAVYITLLVAFCVLLVIAAATS